MLVPDSATATGERLKVLDFGLAKLIEVREAAFVKTHSHDVFGTPLYMSPEQCEGAGRVDAKTDVYALGCMLYEMLTGQPPFLGNGPGQVIGKHMFQEPEPPSRLAPQLPAALNDLVLRLLVKSKDERPTMRDTQKALEALAPSLPPPRRREAEPSGMMSADSLEASGLAATLDQGAAEALRIRSEARGLAPTIDADGRGLPERAQEQAAEAAPLRVKQKQLPSVAAAARPSRRVVLLGAALLGALVTAGLIGLRLTSPKARPALPAVPVPAAAATPPQKAAEPEILPQKLAPEPKKKPTQDIGGDAKRRTKKKPSQSRIF